MLTLVSCAVCVAAAVNSTSGLVRSDQSSLDFVWVKGTYAASVSLQLTAAANQSDFFPSYWANGGIDRGALVHFSSVPMRVRAAGQQLSSELTPIWFVSSGRTWSRTMTPRIHLGSRSSAVTATRPTCRTRTVSEPTPLLPSEGTEQTHAPAEGRLLLL